jgi:hypothetical protein
MIGLKKELIMTDEKNFDELTPEESSELKIVFAPGCFDSFEGTQEELDALMVEIERMFKSGEVQAEALKLNVDDMDDEELARYARALLSEEELAELESLGMPADGKRNLQ